MIGIGLLSRKTTAAKPNARRRRGRAQRRRGILLAGDPAALVGGSERPRNHGINRYFTQGFKLEKGGEVRVEGVGVAKVFVGLDGAQASFVFFIIVVVGV